jgi:hypothetical protein
MRARGLLLLLFSSIFLAASAPAGTVHGTVKNATKSAPAAGVELTLLQLQGGMQAVAETKSDAQGNFTFENPGLGQMPMLVRASYRGVHFHQPVPPGSSSITVEVFEPTRDTKGIHYGTRVVIFQPGGANLLVGEEYAVRNDSAPPQAYYRADGNFELQIPENATLQQAAAWGPSAMPVTQTTLDRGKNKYAIAFAFRPGENGVRLSYQLPYTGDKASLRLPAIYPAEHLLLVAPPGVDLRGEGLTAAGTEQGMNVYNAEAPAAGKSILVQLSGQGTAPPAQAAAGEGESAGPTEDTSKIQMIPMRLDALKWPLVGGFAGIFALGALFLMRKTAPAGMDTRVLAEKPAAGRKHAAPPAHLAEADAHVSTNLEAIKDTLFRLELRRQAGTISEEEYARERAKIEKTMRDIVRG